MVQKVVGSIPISHPIYYAGIVQWLVCKFSKLEMRVQFSLPAPEIKISPPKGPYFFTEKFGLNTGLATFEPAFVAPVDALPTMPIL